MPEVQQVFIEWVNQVYWVLCCLQVISFKSSKVVSNIAILKIQKIKLKEFQ